VTNNETSSTNAIDPTHKLCEQCGHNWDAHLLYGYGSPPTEGWMECPMEGCECKKTWGLSPEMTAQIKAHASSGSATPVSVAVESTRLSRHKLGMLFTALAAFLGAAAFIIFDLLN
jgi:hypothetical protein